MKLYFTPRSHFSRKVRLLARALNLDLELIDAGNVGDAAAHFGPNPLLKVPTLVDDEGRTVFDSDHIAQHLVRRYDPKDGFEVFTSDVQLLNARAVMNGVMAAEVEVILARRTGMDTSVYQRFDKILDSIQRGLTWLESQASIFPESPSYAGFHLTAMWDHLVLYGLVSPTHPALSAHVKRWSALPWVSASAPPPL